MRHLISGIALAAVLAGCASAKKTNPDDWNSKAVEPGSAPTADGASNQNPADAESHRQSYVGVKGYLDRPPLFIDKISQSFFQRCLPIEITAVHRQGGQVLVTAKQENYTVTLSGINRKSFTLSPGGKITLLNQY